jgi:hypothetical protein
MALSDASRDDGGAERHTTAGSGRARSVSKEGCFAGTVTHPGPFGGDSRNRPELARSWWSRGDEPQEGRQSRERPAGLRARETLERWHLGALRHPGMENRRRGGSVKAEPSRGDGAPWRGENPRELRAPRDLTRFLSVADSRAEQDPEVEVARGAFT